MQEKDDAATACGKVAAEEPEKCGGCGATPTPPSTCTPALVIMRHAEDASPNKYDLPGANRICAATCPKALRNNLKQPTGEDRRKLIAAQLDNWVTKQLGLCPITAITTIDPSNGQGCPPYGDKGGSTVNPFWTIATWANDHCTQLDADLNYYVHDEDTGTGDDARPVAGSPSIGPGRDGTTSRALTYTSQGLWSRCSDCDKWDRPKPDEGTLIREAYAGSASEICPPTHEIVWVLTGYDGNQWTKLEQYIMPGVTCQGNCPLAKQTSRTPGIPGYCK